MSVVNINPQLLEEIEEYCKFNDIFDVENEINSMLRKGFNIVKFGDTPFTSYLQGSKPKVIVKETPIETPKIIEERTIEVQNTEQVITEEPKAPQVTQRKVKIIKTRKN